MGIEEVAAAQALDRLMPNEVNELGRVLRQAGFRAWAVGGGVRDGILATFLGRKKPDGDWDLATDARPEQIKPLFRRVIPTGIAHGTVTVLLEGKPFELTTLRGEAGHTDGRHPDSVYFVKDIEEDLGRRDFTVNAIAFDLDARTVADPFGGIADLERGVIRAVGDPILRYREDGLRPLRAARFAATLEMELDEQTRSAMRPCLDRFAQVSAERVQAEWFKALQSRQPSRCFRVLLDEGLLHVTCPELFAGTPSEQLALFWDRLDRAAPIPTRRLAHLFAEGLRGADPSSALAGLRLSNQDKARIIGLVASLPRPHEPAPELVRKWLAQVGRPLAEDALAFAKESQATPAFLAQAAEELASGAPLALPELAISGKDLLEAGLVERGPQIRRLLDALFGRALIAPEENSRERLLSLARELASGVQNS